MRTIIHIMGCLLLSAMLSGCTHNDGDIGPLFGTWRITEITVDGKRDTCYAGNVVWKFQSGVLMIQLVADHHDVVDYWNSWSVEDDVMTLSGNHHDSNVSTSYGFPPQMHLDCNEPNVKFQIVDMDDKNIELCHHCIDSGSVAYKLHKLI
ncbi:MAG: lipocalin-like domain-containing protein [Muribaculaceae bacterium]|nr:lipocalin-like domain-containing protein [Muribaculaceae bacterium]